MNGGGGSSFKIFTWGRTSGPSKAIFIGEIMVDTLFFHTTGEPISSNVSGCLGKPLTPCVPKIDVVTKRKMEAEIMK